MKNSFLYFVCLAIILTININTYSQKKSTEYKQKVMHRFVVERTFPNGLEIPINSEGQSMCLNVVMNNSEEEVTWVHSYDKKKTFCIYDAPSAEAIRRVAKMNNLPVDNIIEVSVLDPYFYK